jgi:hypothetical protein
LFRRVTVTLPGVHMFGAAESVDRLYKTVLAVEVRLAEPSPTD